MNLRPGDLTKPIVLIEILQKRAIETVAPRGHRLSWRPLHADGDGATVEGDCFLCGAPIYVTTTPEPSGTYLTGEALVSFCEPSTIARVSLTLRDLRFVAALLRKERARLIRQRARREEYVPEPGKFDADLMRADHCEALGLRLEGARRDALTPSRHRGGRKPPEGSVSESA